MLSFNDSKQHNAINGIETLGTKKVTETNVTIRNTDDSC